MAYTPKTWADGEAGGTPITAAELNRIEQGIDDAHAATGGPVSVSDVTGLQGELDGKAAVDHTHTAAEVGAAAASHSHQIGDVAGLQSIIDDLTSRLEALETE